MSGNSNTATDAASGGTAGNDVNSAKRRSGKRRRRLASVVLAVVLPTAVTAAYLYGFASDQYVSEFRFAVRQQHPLSLKQGSVATALGGTNPLLAVIADSEVVVQYIKSHQIIDDIRDSVSLDTVYGKPDADWWARLAPSAPAERRLRYWRNAVDPFFDLSTGIVSVEVRAFSPEEAQQVAVNVLSASEKLVNGMSGRAHRDALTYAENTVMEAETRLKQAEADLANYRNAHKVLFPEMTATTSATLEGQLRAQLADARTALSSVRAQGQRDDSTQVRILERRITGIESELSGVRSDLTRDDAHAVGYEPNLPLASVISGYSGLQAEERIGEQLYTAALSELQEARTEANQQLVYLDAFVRPALPQESIYPVRWRLLLEVALSGFAAWCLIGLLAQGIRDHID